MPILLQYINKNSVKSALKLIHVLLLTGTTFINFPDYSIPLLSVVIIHPVEIIRNKVETIIEATAINLKEDILISTGYNEGVTVSV